MARDGGGGVKKRRFRKRGGAKKKKKTDNGPPADDKGDRQGPPKRTRYAPEEQAPLPHQSGSFSGNYSANYSGFDTPASSLEPNLLSYVLKIQEDLNELTGGPDFNQQKPVVHADDDDDDDVPAPHVLLARNALSELQPKMHEVAMDPCGSHILELLFRFADDDETMASTLSSMVSLGSGRLAVLAEHRCGSHVLQALVTAVSSPDFAGSVAHPAMLGIVRLLSEWDFGTLVSVMSNSSGSHVLRTIFAALAGIPVDEPREAKIDDSEGGKIRTYIERLKREVPPEWMEGLKHAADCLLSSENPSDIQNLAWETASCASLQGLVAGLSCCDSSSAEKLARTVMENQLQDLVYHPVGSRFVERAIACLGSGIIWEEVKDHIGELVQHPRGNFVAQRIFLGLKGRGQIVFVWNQVEEMMPKLLGFGAAREGVVLALLRSTENEGDVIIQRRANRAVSKALGMTGANAKDLIGVLLTGSVDSWAFWRESIANCGKGGLGIRETDHDVLQCPRSLPYFNTIGLLMARCLLRFSEGAGQTARDSMGTLSQLDLLALCGNPVGSRLLEQWIDLDPKNAARFLNALLSNGGKFAVCGAARSPYGSQLLSRTVPQVPEKLRGQVLGHLAERMSDLKLHRFGTIAIRKCRVEQYARDGMNAQGGYSAKDNRRRLFSDILDGDGDTKSPASPAKQRKSKSKSKKVRASS